MRGGAGLFLRTGTEQKELREETNQTWTIGQEGGNKMICILYAFVATVIVFAILGIIKFVEIIKKMFE